MSLVSYADSSDSEEEVANIESLNSNISLTNDASSVTTETKIFTALPTPVKVDVIFEEQDDFLNKKETRTEISSKAKQPVKIVIPSLLQFDSDDDEETRKKKRKIQEKSSGLFAVLPPPKYIQRAEHLQIVPQVLRNKSKANKIVNRKKVISKESTRDQSIGSDSDDEIPIPDTFDDATWQKVCGRQKKVFNIIMQPTVKKEIEPAPELVKPYQGLDNQAFKELLGANGKRKKDEIDIIDINEDEMLPDKDIWMTKSLTDPEMAPKYVVKDPVNDTCRRKHHITYLAQQAKANEQELKNQWAQNKYTRQKTQAKYGF